MTVRRDGRGRNAQWQAWTPPEPTPTERRQEQLRRREWLAERSKADD
jgi:hypothetical protein